MPDDSPPASGGVPTPGPGNLWWSPAHKRNMDETLRRFRQGLSNFESTARSNSSYIPPVSATISGLMRDYLARAVGLIRFGANIQGFEFTPSIGIVAKDLRNLENGLRDFTVPLTRAVKQVIIPSINQNFIENGRPPWEPLDPATVEKHRSKIGLGPTPILQRTGRLRKAATSFSIWSINPVSAVIKSLPQHVWYGNIHQEGSAGAAGKSWFKTYQVRARNILGAGASQREVDAVAWRIFDQRMFSGAFREGRGRIEIPQRRFVAYQDEDFQKIQQIFYDWMDGVIVSQGRFIPGFPL